MAGIPHDHYEPKTGGGKWLHSRLPIAGLMYDVLTFPTPRNLNWMWIWGIVLTFCLAMQIITGIVLACITRRRSTWHSHPSNISCAM
jgi:ubiquinol-cytochrome c reductase cytochrome b subunit